MDDARSVGCMQRRSNLREQIHRLCKRQRLFVLQSLRQAFAFEQIHHKERHSAFIAIEVGDRQDVRVTQRRDQTGFILKPLIDIGAGS